MGVVINRPSSVNVTHALSEHFNLPTIEDTIFMGGPVEPGALSVIHSSHELAGGDDAFLPDVFLGSSADIFERVVQFAADDQHFDMHFRIFSGYAGWSASQLEGEVARGDWYSVPASSQFLFEEDPYEVYDLLMHKIYNRNHRFACPSDRVEWN